MRKIVIIGLGPFGKRMLDAFHAADVDILIIDTNKDRINENKNKANSAYITNILNLEALKKVVPDHVDAAVVACEDGFETSLLVTHLLKKMEVRNILVRADSENQEEILYLAGASSVIIPDREAAMATSRRIMEEKEYIHAEISPGFFLTEVPVSKKIIGKTVSLLESLLGVRLIGVGLKKAGKSIYSIIETDHVFEGGDMLLVAGKEEALLKGFGKKKIGKGGIVSLINRIFHT